MSGEAVDSMATPEPRTAVLHGQSVAWTELPGPGPLLLLVHGVGSSRASWDTVLPPLAGAGVAAVAVDLPGHGDSGKDRGDYSLGALASCLRDLLDHLGQERCVLVGHSLGGGVALQFAYQFPQRCDGLVLVASGGLGPEAAAGHQHQPVAPLGELVGELQRHATAERVADQDAALLAEVVEQVAQAAGEGPEAVVAAVLAGVAVTRQVDGDGGDTCPGQVGEDGVPAGPAGADAVNQQEQRARARELGPGDRLTVQDRGAWFRSRHAVHRLTAHREYPPVTYVSVGYWVQGGVSAWLVRPRSAPVRRARLPPV